MTDTIRDVDQLETLLSEPNQGVVEMMRRLPGDILILGVGGKMGPTLARMARRAADAAGAEPPRHRRRAVLLPGARGATAVARRRDDSGRSVGPGRGGGAARRGQRRLHGRHEVRHDRPAAVDLGDERGRARHRRSAVCPEPHRRPFDGQRLRAGPGRTGRFAGNRRAQPGRRVCQQLPRPRAGLRALRRPAQHAHRDPPAQLRRGTTLFRARHLRPPSCGPSPSLWPPSGWTSPSGSGRRSWPPTPA